MIYSTRILSIFPILVFIGVCIVATSAQSETIKPLVKIVTVANRFGDTSTTLPCDGNGHCDGSAIIVYHKGDRLEARDVVMDFTLNGSMLTAECKTRAPWNGKTFNVSKEYTLNSEISQALGCRSITILKNRAAPDFSHNPLGTVVLKVNVLR